MQHLGNSSGLWRAFGHALHGAASAGTRSPWPVCITASHVHDAVASSSPITVQSSQPSYTSSASPFWIVFYSPEFQSEFKRTISVLTRIPALTPAL